MTILAKKALNTTVAFSLLVSLMPQSAQANCGATAAGGSGPPSISATEVSTAQALQLIRKRRDEALSGGAPAPIQVAQVTPAPAPAPAAQAPKPTPPAASAPPASAAVAPSVAKVAKPAPAPKAPKVASVVVAKKAPQADTVVRVPAYSQGSVKDDSMFYAPEPTRAAWVQAYGDYERHDGWTLDGGNRGELTSKQYTAGAVTGMDWVARGAMGSSSKLLVGVLGGISATSTDFNNVSYSEASTNTNNANTRDQFDRTDAREHISGGGGGVYAVLTDRRFSADILAKVDGYNLEQTDTVRQTATFDATDPVGTLAGCGASVPVGRRGETDFAMFTLATNAAYRYDLGANSFWEPTIGLRYTHVAYGNQTGTLPLGLTDGDALRLQGGARIGTVRDLPDGKIWVTTLGAMLYSDVIVDGFSKVNSLGFNTAKIDEGKVRVLGQLSTSLVTPAGYTYTLSGDIRGGEDVFGIGGKVGIRYEW